LQKFGQNIYSKRQTWLHVTVGAVKEENPSAPAQTAAPAPPPKAPPAEQTKEEQKIKDPGKAEANIASDSEELLKRKMRKGEQPQ
jgi:hypothetical protein